MRSAKTDAVIDYAIHKGVIAGDTSISESLGPLNKLFGTNFSYSDLIESCMEQWYEMLPEEWKSERPE